MFGVYLYHIGRFNRFLYLNLYYDVEVYETPYFLFFIVGTVLTIFVVGIFLDKVRIYLLERPIMRGLETRLSKLNAKVAALYPDSKQ